MIYVLCFVGSTDVYWLLRVFVVGLASVCRFLWACYSLLWFASLRVGFAVIS